MAVKEGLAGILYRGLERAGVLETFGAEQRAHLRSLYYLTLTSNVTLIHELAGILELFNRERIAVVLLQGIALLRDVYIDPGLRPTTDIDLWVLPADLPSAASILVHAGYDRDPLYPTTFRKGGTIFDIQSHLFWAERIRMRGRLVRRAPEEIFQHTRIVDFEGHNVRTLGTHDQLTYLILHALKHGLQRLIWLVDIMALVSGWEVADWEGFLRRARDLEQERAVSLALFLLVRLFRYQPSLPAKQLLERQRRPGLEEAILRRRVPGQTLPPWAHLILLSAGKNWRTRFLFILESLFPRPKILRQVFADLRGRSTWALYWKRVLQVSGALAGKGATGGYGIMESKRYDAWSLKLHRDGVARRTPLNGTIEVTRRCNLSCAHCYTNLPRDAQETGELSSREHRRMIDELTDFGCLWLLFTGGEIFAREDFLEIYFHAKQRGLIITLFTNGTLITPTIADYLAEWRPFSIEVTIYGRTRETYERVTGVPGSYHHCLQGIELLMERRLPLALKTLAVKSNVHELWDLKSFAEEELGLEFRFDAMVNPRVDGFLSPLRLRLNPDEVVRLDLMDSERRTEWHRFCAQFNKPHPRDREFLYQCGGALHSFAVTPEGTLVPCVLSRRSGYDLRGGSFREGWQRVLGPLREEKVRRETQCSACEIKDMCGMCPANGELENGDAEEPVDFLCRVAHLRAYALGLPVSYHGDCDYCQGGGKYQELSQTARLVREQTG